MSNHTPRRYDWHDDSDVADSEEGNFGTTLHAYYNASMPYIPKPSFVTAATLAAYVSPSAYQGAIHSTNNNSSTVYALSFQSTSEQCQHTYVAWALGGDPVCSQPIIERRDCGYVAISEAVCRFQGCCFDLDSLQCFYPAVPVAAIIETSCANTCFQAVSYLNQTSAAGCSDDRGRLQVQLDDAPVIFVALET